MGVAFGSVFGFGTGIVVGSMAGEALAVAGATNDVVAIERSARTGHICGATIGGATGGVLGVAVGNEIQTEWQHKEDPNSVY